MMNKGVYIALEGMDGVGKSTVMPYIEDYIKSKGRDVVTVREIGSTPLGERLRDIIKSDCPMDATSELLLMLTARHQLFNDIVRPALADGKVVISDRYYMSTIAYQCDGKSTDPDPALVATLHDALHLRSWADYVFILQKPFEEAIKAQGGDDRFENNLAYQRRVYNFYDRLGAPFFDKSCYGAIHKIAVDRDVNKTVEQITSKLDI